MLLAQPSSQVWHWHFTPIGWKLSSLKHLGSLRDLSAMQEVPGWTDQKASIPFWAKMTPIITDITIPARTALTAYAASSMNKHANTQVKLETSPAVSKAIAQATQHGKVHMQCRKSAAGSTRGQASLFGPEGPPTPQTSPLPPEQHSMLAVKALQPSKPSSLSWKSI